MTDATDRVAGVTTTLLCSPSMETDGGDCCPALLAAGAEVDREVLWVTYTRSPEECVQSVPDDLPVRGVLTVGDAPHWETTLDGVDVDVVATPEDNTALGIKLSRFLSGTDGLVVCFDSVTAMCQYVEPQTAYGFLHTIMVQLYDAGATAHFHIDPVAHEESTVDLFASLCDAVVDASGDEATVRARPE
jgi:hypothetical protein